MNNESTYISAFNKMIGGRFISVNTELIKLFGGNGAILLAQCCYYDVSIANEKKELLTNKAGEKNLYWEHTDEQWYNEIHFGETALKNTKANLVAAGVIEILRAGQPAKSKYRVNLQKVIELLAGNTSENTGSSSGETPDKFGGNTGSSSGVSSELDQVKHRNIRDNNTKDNKTENKDIEFFVKNSEFSEITQTSESEEKEISDKLSQGNYKDFDNQEFVINANETSNIIDFKHTENSTKNEINKIKKVGKSKSNSVGSQKEKENVTPEQKAVRAEIRNYLARKCFHASNETEIGMLTASQAIQLNVNAQKLEKLGITTPDVEAWWNWFTNGGDFRGTNVAKAEGKGLKINTAPAIVAETWLAFKNSSPVSNSNETTYERNENVFNDSFDDEDVEETFEIVAMVTEDEYYDTLRSNWIQKYGQQGIIEINKYENTNEFKLRFRRMAA